ncbi:MAG TPA: protease inhibitor I42 family protein [Bacteroidia bacterium]|jgi:predicted secreted protein|nr:protease inhibitor I42 family protein [Bacteroidia bacterium]
MSEPIHPIILVTEQIIQIDLPGKGSSGYTWTFKCRTKDILKITRQYIIPDKHLAGGSGIERFSITALQPGTCIVDFQLSRSWETDRPPLESKSYLFTVQAVPASA